MDGPLDVVKFPAKHMDFLEGLGGAEAAIIPVPVYGIRCPDVLAGAEDMPLLPARSETTVLAVTDTKDKERGSASRGLPRRN